MTVTLERPTASATESSGARNGRRAIMRWALRLFKREWRQQVLVVSLLIVAVAATTVGLGLVGNVISGDAAIFGTANTRIDIDATAPTVNVAAEVAQARQLFGNVEVIEHVNVPVPGTITPVDLRAQAQQGSFSSPMLRVVTGRYPVRSRRGRHDLGAGNDVPAEARFDLDRERPRAARRRHSRESEESAGRFRPRRSGPDHPT